MIIDELIKNENTTHLWDAWKSYRERLTDYIIDSVEHYEIRKWLRENKKVRIPKEYSKDYSIEEIVRRYEVEKGNKPVLAIWGAGCCSDMDIGRLSKYFRLVLIDRDIDNIEQARAQAGLNNEACACVDIRFFDISYSEYEMLEAMLQDGCTYGDLSEYLKEIADRAVAGGGSGHRFDYSICAGLASQLVSRFAALAYRYGRLAELEDELRRMSKAAVGGLCRALFEYTGELLIIGYELYEIYADTDAYREVDKTIAIYNEAIDELRADGELDRILDTEEFDSQVEGNCEMILCLKKAIADNRLRGIFESRVDEWPFTEKKHYIVNNIVCEMFSE